MRQDLALTFIPRFSPTWAGCQENKLQTTWLSHFNPTKHHQPSVVAFPQNGHATYTADELNLVVKDPAKLL